MKKVLLASTALVLSAGIAAADVSVGGSGRMGVIAGFDNPLTASDESELAFTSRIRISFSASGETDAGLQFGGSVRADNAGGGNSGTAGSVFVSGSFGTISMGDVSGAAEAAVGDLSGVGLTGLGDLNEFGYLSNATKTAASASSPDGLVSGQRSMLRWDYTVADFGVHVSHSNPGDATTAFNLYADGATVSSIAVSYSMGDIAFGLGYEALDSDTAGLGDVDHLIGGVSAGFGDVTMKAIYGTADADDAGGDFDQYGVSLDFVSGATTFTAFYVANDLETGETPNALGLGVSYDLGGGAAIKAGWVTADPDDGSDSEEAYDLGISMSF